MQFPGDQQTRHNSFIQQIFTESLLCALRKTEQCPQVKKKLWGGEFWTDGYFVATVGKNQNETVIKEYVKNQGKQVTEYRQLHLALDGIAGKDTP